MKRPSTVPPATTEPMRFFSDGVSSAACAAIGVIATPAAAIIRASTCGILLSTCPAFRASFALSTDRFDAVAVADGDDRRYAFLEHTTTARVGRLVLLLILTALVPRAVRDGRVMVPVFIAIAIVY